MDKIKRKKPLCLGSALIALQVATPSTSEAQSKLTQSTMELRYNNYLDFQNSGDRIGVEGGTIYLETPLNDSFSFQGSYGVDSVSGASPAYLDSLSGASAQGINDFRNSGYGKITYQADSSSLTLGANYSNEQDYDSVGGSVESRFWTEDKNSTFLISAGSNFDQISSTVDPTIDEDKKTWNASLGLIQITSPKTILYTSLNYSNGNGYFSDPYKPFDSRPTSRDTYSILTKLNYYIETFDASIHNTLRYSYDAWSIESMMYELAYFHPLFENLTLKPRFRYYSQSNASFFTGYYPPSGDGDFFSADQRLSAFGSFTLGLGARIKLTDSFSLDFSYDYFIQDNNLGVYSSSVDLQTLKARFYTLGLRKTF